MWHHAQRGSILEEVEVVRCLLDPSYIIRHICGYPELELVQEALECPPHSGVSQPEFDSVWDERVANRMVT